MSELVEAMKRKSEAIDAARAEADAIRMHCLAFVCVPLHLLRDSQSCPLSCPSTLHYIAFVCICEWPHSLHSVSVSNVTECTTNSKLCLKAECA